MLESSEPTRGSRLWQADVTALLVVAVTALVTRVAVAATVPDAAPIYDMQEYWERAIYIFEHGRLYEDSWRMPGYPAALAAIFAMASGPSLTAARALNTVAGVATAVLTYWLARRSSGHRASLIAGLSVALYPSLLFHTALVTTEALVTAPLIGALIAATYKTRTASAAAGFLAGLTALVRPAGIALLPAIVIACAHRAPNPPDRKRWVLVAPALALATCALTLSPWWLHNAQLYGRFIPLDTGFGVNLMIGNGPRATGRFESGVFGALQMEMTSRTPEGSDRLAALTLAHMRAHPLDTLALVPTKVHSLLAMEGRDPGYLYSQSYFGQLQPLTVWSWGVTILMAFPLLLAGAIAGWSIRGGIARRVLEPCLLFAAGTVAMHVVLYGDARYHLELIPVLAVLATGLSRWRAGIVPWRACAGALILVWLAFATWLPQFTTFGTVLQRLAAPDGSSIRLEYDDLLHPNP